MSNCCKEEEERSGMEKDCSDLKMERHEHGFKLRYQYKMYAVSCDAPTTLRERLQTEFYFKAICKKNQNQKEVVLLIHREQIPNVAVSLDIPCCLIKDDKLLNIKFIKSEVKGSAKPKMRPINPSLMNSPENLVTFYVKTKGGNNIRKVMKNKELCKIADYICVFAYKGEKVEAALKRDGRFNKVIFRKGELSEEGTEVSTGMSSPVQSHLNGKQFQVVISEYQTGSQGASQELNQEPNQEPSEQSETVAKGNHKVPGSSQSEKTSHESTRAQEGKAQTPSKERKTRKYPNVKPIPNTGEILNLLRDQFGCLLKKLKERENLRNKADLQKFFRQEFDKSVDSFSEVKRVKDLMFLSDSVCQIQVCNSSRGTGFLLFKRFVITNAHVVEQFYDPVTKEPNRPITAVFFYEDHDTGDHDTGDHDTGDHDMGDHDMGDHNMGDHNTRDHKKKEEKIVKRIVVCIKAMDEMGNHLDFALLELDLSDDKTLLVPELLNYYSAPPCRGALCIIGHPGGEVKKMDHSFIIPKQDVKKEANDHVAKNQDYLHIITQMAMEEKWEIRESQISYNTCFFHGSSGSPVFDEFCRLIGVHTGGYVYEGKGEETRSVVEYALPMFPILVHICKLCYLNDDTEKLQYFQSRNNTSLVLKRAEELAERHKQANRL